MKLRPNYFLTAGLLALIMPGAVNASDTDTPYIQYVEIVSNQVHIVGQDLFYESDRAGEFALVFETSNDQTSATYRFSFIADPDFGPTIAAYSENEMALRIGILPSTFTGTVVLETPRGNSEPVEFSIDNPYCVVTAPMVSSLIGGEDADWTATPSNWLFSSEKPERLFVPYVGTLTVPGNDQPIPVFLSEIETTTAVYDCSMVTRPHQAVSAQ